MSRTSCLSIVVSVALAGCGRSESTKPPPKAIDAKAAATTPSQLDVAREKYLMLDAALEKLKGKIAVATDPKELADLKDKQLALSLAIKDIRQQIETMESLEKQKQPSKPQ